MHPQRRTGRGARAGIAAGASRATFLAGAARAAQAAIAAPAPLVACAALAAWWAAATAVAAGAPVGLQPEAVFSEYTPLAGNHELMQRLLTPLATAAAERSLVRSKEALVAQSIDLAAEKFLLYVPPRAPPGGYGLLVFVPPWDEPRLPQGWAGVLDRQGMILVAAVHSGNDINVLGRREPLALLAAYNVMRRYPLDARRVYVGGFSGGSRIALRLALGYPDLFRGALLNAGSDPLGTGMPPLPPRKLFERFQESTRLVYVTGERDALHLSMDAASLDSMRTWCVFDVTAQTTPWVAHELMSAATLARSLRELATSRTPDPRRLAACRARINAELSGQLAAVRALIAAGKRADAAKRLGEIDLRFGGLAAPASLELEAQLPPQAGGQQESGLQAPR
jgi:hypothetical protein